MPTPVFITIDTEFAARHYVAGHDVDTIYARSLEPAGVGLSFQLDRFRRHGLKACFFVDPMPAIVFGIDPVRRMVESIIDAGQEVQLHLHPHWAAADADDRSVAGKPHLHQYDRHRQQALIAQATDLLIAAGAPRPIAFRAGNYAANDDTLAALAAQGFRYDSSHNGAQRGESRITLPDRCIAPQVRALIELPVTVIEDRPGRLRTMQLCALSQGEMTAALHHASAHDHAAVTIVSHGFELANRSGLGANQVHVRRFAALCRLLERHADRLPTRHFADHPALAIGQADEPLPPNRLRTGWRQAEQLWSNWVAERSA